MNQPQDPKLPEFAVPLAFLEQLGMLLEKGVERLNQFQKETLRPLGLTGKHLVIFLFLEKKGSANLKAIGDFLHADPATVAGWVKDMEKLGMAQTRSQKVSLTDAGRGIISQRVRKTPLKFLSSLTPQEQKTLVSLIRKVMVSQFSAQNK